MNYKTKIQSRIFSFFTRISSIMIPIYQYVPATAIWFGIMSVPILSYITYYFQNPRILKYDLQFSLKTPGFYFTIFGLILFLYSLVYQLTYRKQLIQKGPYKYVRHPQYIAFIIIEKYTRIPSWRYTQRRLRFMILVTESGSGLRTGWENAG